MSDIQTSHEPGHSAADKPFSDAELAHFQREDIYAGGTVIVLMSTIFSMGVVLYTIVLISVL